MSNNPKPDSDQPLLERLDAFIATMHAVRSDLSFEPAKEHIATCINYSDLIEMRSDFVRELTNTITAFVYSPTKQKQLVEALKGEGRSDSAAWSQLLTRANQKFRRASLRGQFCELLLSNLLQHYFKAAPLLRKMSLTTNPNQERNGVDAIHVANLLDRQILYIGEAKSCEQQNSPLKIGLVEAIRDVRLHYENHRNELNLYTFEDFVDPALEDLARRYLAGTAQLEVNLVCIVAYEDRTVANGACRDDILKATLEAAMSEAASVASHRVLLDFPKNLIPRLNYIVFPIREMSEVIRAFTAKIANG